MAPNMWHPMLAIDSCSQTIRSEYSHTLRHHTHVAQGTHRHVPACWAGQCAPISVWGCDAILYSRGFWIVLEHQKSSLADVGFWVINRQYTRDTRNAQELFFNRGHEISAYLSERRVGSQQAHRLLHTLADLSHASFCFRSHPAMPGHASFCIGP